MAEGPGAHEGDLAAVLRAAHDQLRYAAFHSWTRPLEDATRTALDQAAGAAEAVKAGRLEEQAGRTQGVSSPG